MTLIRFLISAKSLRVVALFFAWILISNFRTGYCAQPGGAGFLFLEEPLNPRAIGMGSAGTAAADGGYAYYNPALSAYAPRGLTRLEYGQKPDDLSQGHLESAWYLGENFYSALDWHFWSIGKIGITNEQTQAPYLYGTSQDSRIGLLAAYSFRNVAFGLAVNGIQSRIVTSSAYGVSFSAGAATAFLNNRLRVGLAAFNEGWATSYLTFPRDLKRNRMPRSARMGLAYCDTVQLLPFTVALDAIYRDENESFLAPIGCEIKPTQYLALRIGKRLNHDTEIFNCGLGIFFMPLNIDCSFVTAKLGNDYEPHWQLGLTYALSR